MAENAKCELSYDSPENWGLGRSYANGPHGTLPEASLDGIGSFRDNGNGRPFSTAASMSKAKANDLPPLSQCLILEPITRDDQKYSRCSELRKTLGFSFGGISDDGSFCTAHSKFASSPTIDELKQFRGSVQECNDKARIWVKRLGDSMNKLTAYLRKLQMNEISRGTNSLKIGVLPHMKSPDPVTQKVDDMGKNVQSKRACSPVADMLVEGRVTSIPRQLMVLGKDKEIIKEGSLSLDSIEDMDQLPFGGETCDRRMKRRRSVSIAFPRPVESDGEIKRAMRGRISCDSGMPSSDATAFRPVSSNGGAVSTKPDGSPFASGSNVLPVPKNEIEKLGGTNKELGGTNKDKILQNCNNKVNVNDENHLVNPCSLTKGNPSRASRAGPSGMDNSPPFSHMTSTPEDWEIPSSINNRKRVFSSESPSHPMAQWVGQRPQKMSRIRRTSIISPTSNSDEALISSEGCTASDYFLTSGAVNGSLPARRIASNVQQLKLINENTPSPATVSESEAMVSVEDSAVGKVESEERGINGSRQIGSPGLLTKKIKLPIKEEIGEGVHKQGRSGRSSSFSRGSMSPLVVKLDSPPKPVQSTKPGSDKNGSKSGRPPLKKHSERKGFTRLIVPNGELDNDREDLMEAARFTCNANFLACSSSFWKKMEPLFYIMADDKSFLLQQLNALDEHQGRSSEMFISHNDMAWIPPPFQKDTLREDKHQPRNDGPEGEKVIITSGFEPTNSEAVVDKGQGNDIFSWRDFQKEHTGMTRLHHRVLSALIMEEELDELEQNNSFFSASEGACSMEENIFCNENAHRCSNIDSPQVDLFQGDCSFIQSEVGVLLPASSQSSLNGLLTSQINRSSDSSSQGHYALMTMDEKLLAVLQSIGLHLETAPDFAEGEGELFTQEMLLLQKQFHQEANKKKLCLERIWKAVEVEKGLEHRDFEQIAVSRLVVLAYRKLLATRGSNATRIGVSKVPRHVALAFVKRTLARCRKFGETGKSCFSEPGLWDIILAGPYDKPGTEQLGNHNDKPGRVLVESCDPDKRDHPYAENGLILNSGKKKEVLLHNVGSGASLKPSPLGNTLMGGVKGNRSDRDKDILSKSGCSSVSNIRGDRKAKSKPKQRGSQLLTHPLFTSTSRLAELGANGSSRKQGGLALPGNILDSSKEAKDPADLTNLPLHELESVELGVVDDAFDGHQDLSSWLSLDDDIVLDHDSMGLEIPMDDLSELSILL